MTRSREEWEKIVYCATDVGEHMLKSGAEVHRVEDTVRRICTAYGAERTDVFTITSSIVVTVYVSDFTTVTETRRVSHSVNDMLKLDEDGLNYLLDVYGDLDGIEEAVNQFCDDISQLSW